jgi:hypothetical protein
MNTDPQSQRLPSTFPLELSTKTTVSTIVVCIKRIRRPKPRKRCLVALLFAILAFPMSFAEMPEPARTTIDRIIGTKGIYIADEGVYRIVLPRHEATVVLDYQTLSPDVGLNSWVAFKSAIHHEALLTGEFLLLEDEVNSVLSAALNAGLEVTGLADSSVFDGPRLKVLDVTGTGSYQNLATAFHNAYEQIKRVRSHASSHAQKVALPKVPLESSITPGPINDILLTKGLMSEGVYTATIGRRGLLHGEMIEKHMGLITWIAFTGTDDRALVQGEFVATTDELQLLLRALRFKGINITSIRNHTVGEHPQYLFVRFWEEGPATELARNIRYAISAQVGIVPPPPLDKTL